MSQAAGSVQLPYERPTPPPPWHRDRRVRKAAYWVLACAIAYGLWLWVPPLWDRLHLLRIQRDAATAPSTAGLVLLSTAGAPPAPANLTASTAIYWQYERLWKRTHRASWIGASDRLLFLQRLVTKTGDERIVVVFGALVPPTATTDGSLSLTTCAYRIHGKRWALWPRTKKGASSSGLIGGSRRQISLKAGDQFTLTGGAADPLDASHVSFNYTLNGQPGAFHAYLIDADSGTDEPAAGLDFDNSFRARPWGGSGVAPRRPR